MPEPRLQVDAPNELRQMRAAEEAALNSYGWVDKEAGVVKIPVDRAMEILAEERLAGTKAGSKDAMMWLLRNPFSKSSPHPLPFPRKRGRKSRTPTKSPPW